MNKPLPLPTQNWFVSPELPKVSLYGLFGDDGVLDDRLAGSSNFIELSLANLLNKLKNIGVLTRLEWLILFNRNDEFEEMTPAEKKTACNIIWNHILSSKSLFQLVIPRVIRSVEQGFESYTQVIFAAMPSTSTKLTETIDKLRLAWAAAAINRDWKSCASMARTQKNIAADLSARLGFSDDAKYIKEINAMAAEVIPRGPTNAEQQWWVDCQDEVPASETIRQLEILVPKLAVVDSGGPIDIWLQKFCLPNSPDTIWPRLSKATQDSLARLYNVTSYDLVKKFFAGLRQTSGDMSLADADPNRLQRRIDFWSEYSDSFLNVRFLLTERTHILLKSQFNFDSSRFTIMSNTPQNNRSEICIFEFDKWIVIEFFRGYEPLKIYNKERFLYTDRLFSIKKIDAQIINQLPAELHHDHEFLWQYYCKIMLQKQCRIYPNVNSVLRSQKSPNPEKIKDREHRLMMLNHRNINH
ncbi:MAG: hypothetical protein ACI88A_004132 [Paraglaciecola sp.]